MSDKAEQFRQFSTERLIEIVKNAKQFGYDDTIVNTALGILKERDITLDDLKLTGNSTNYRYDHAREIYTSYNKNSGTAFLLYLIIVVFKLILIFKLTSLGAADTSSWIIYAILLFAYFFFIIRSFLNYNNFYKEAGKEPGTGDQIAYLLVGMPFYIFMYFFYKGQMKEEMRMIH